ncbi:hypothetical protein AB1E18_015214 [Capra hircus]
MTQQSDFLQRHFPPQSTPSHHLNLSLCSPKKPSPWDCCTILEFQLPAAVPSRRPASLSGSTFQPANIRGTLLMPPQDTIHCWQVHQEYIYKWNNFHRALLKTGRRLGLLKE